VAKASQTPVLDAEFGACLRALLPDLKSQKNIAVAVSGGGDSLALLWLLSRWSKDIHLHALTVDHGLRPESKLEAKQVAMWVKEWPHVTHKILKWQGAKPSTKISETARTARYKLLTDYCRRQKIDYLFVAHNLDDQAETFLLRLAAGSGLDGLAGMKPVSITNKVILVRPLLKFSHDRLLKSLQQADISHIEDPTNKNESYARPRLRAARDMLAREGLTPERLATTAERLARGRAALETITDQMWQQHVTCTKTQIVWPTKMWRDMPEDLRIRMVQRALTVMSRKKVPVRLEQVEELAMLMARDVPATLRRTLHGCIISRGSAQIRITVEKGLALS
jgi:tRNA(Ile)-lysidine synthase